MENEPPAKRRRLDANAPKAVTTNEDHASPSSNGLNRPISPPLSRRKSPAITSTLNVPSWGFDNIPKQQPPILEENAHPQQNTARAGQESTKFVSSPVQLTRIRDLPPNQNNDAVGLNDILGDPMIKECWNFNFLFDLDFVMKQFDEDVKDLVKVKIIHGFWKNDDERRIALLEGTERYPNIELLHAYIPDPFGTHHTKMLVLFRHDDLAQVVIHTANMISRDWGNMTQAVWCSPLLPLISPSDTGLKVKRPFPIGSGQRFKVDLLRYLKAYGNRLNSLTKQLADYDFSSVRAAFIGSAPSRQKPAVARPTEHTSFGWLGLQEILSTTPVMMQPGNEAPHIVMQISSIATLGAAPTWLTQLRSVLSRNDSSETTREETASSSTKSSKLFAQNRVVQPKMKDTVAPQFNIIFPTPEEIRTSLDGYASGASIHIKLQSTQQQKQLEYLHPLLCHWKHVSNNDQSAANQAMRREALRGPAAPHIKTYIRFTDERHQAIDWAMVTSANLSKQAWGDVVNKKDEIWIQSWEAGVVVWPALFASSEESEDPIMVPVFGRDMPTYEDVAADSKKEVVDTQDGRETRMKVVGFRMPYDLPLRPYTVDEKPWCATMQYREPDWKGLAWGGY